MEECNQMEGALVQFSRRIWKYAIANKFDYYFEQNCP